MCGPVSLCLSCVRVTSVSVGCVCVCVRACDGVVYALSVCVTACVCVRACVCDSLLLSPLKLPDASSGSVELLEECGERASRAARGLEACSGCCWMWGTAGTSLERSPPHQTYSVPGTNHDNIRSSQTQSAQFTLLILGGKTLA